MEKPFNNAHVFIYNTMKRISLKLTKGNGKEDTVKMMKRE